MSKIPGAARSDKAKETHMDKLTPFFKKKKRILKKGLTKRKFCYILNKSSAMSHQKRQQLNKMESWLSGRRRTIGNRVGVMSVSRVQIPNSPP